MIAAARAAAATINPIRCVGLIRPVVGIVVDTLTAQLLSARWSVRVSTLALHDLIRDREAPRKNPLNFPLRPAALRLASFRTGANMRW